MNAGLILILAYTILLVQLLAFCPRQVFGQYNAVKCKESHVDTSQAVAAWA